MQPLQGIPAFKVVLLGDSGVGKTSIVQQFERKEFQPAKDSTIGASFMSREIETGNGPIKLHIWDTAGQERYRSLVPTYARGACAAVIVFDLSVSDTLQSVNRWIQSFKGVAGESALTYIVGNKSDLVATAGEAEAMLGDNVDAAQLFIVSAKRGTGIDDMFHAIADEIAVKKPTPVQQFAPQIESEQPVETGDRAQCC
jgi:small GTP-binding protein